MIENIHILMGQGLKKLTIGNLTLWRRQDVRQKELKEKNRDLLQCTEVISCITLEETEYRLRDAISSKEKETIELKRELSIITAPEEDLLLSVQSDIQSNNEFEEKPLHGELTVLRSQFNEIKQENKKLSDKSSKMKVAYLRSLTSNTCSAACKVRRGMNFEIDDCKFHLKAMTCPDYQLLVDNNRIIEKLQERITLMNMQLITEREHNENIKKEIKEAEDKRQSKKEQIINKKEMCLIYLSCKHPVTGKLMSSFLKVHKDELLPSVLDKAYKLMKLAPRIPIERCRLVKYNIKDNVMDQSFDVFEFQHHTIGQLAGGARIRSSFKLFLETCKESEIFRKYNDGGINLLISVVDLSTGEVGPAKPMRGEKGWTVRELKHHIGESFNIHSSCMRLVMEEYGYRAGISVQLRDEDRLILYGSKFYVSSDTKDYQKEYKDSLMYRYVEFHINMILLSITIPFQPEATSTITNVYEEGIVMKIMSEENKGEERKIQVQVDKRITLAHLKEELVPLIGVPPAGFRVYEIRYGEMEELNMTLMGCITSGSELIVRLGRALRRGEYRITLYLLQVNDTKFCTYLIESIVVQNTSVREFKKQITEEAKLQGIDCVLELDKMRLRCKDGVSPGIVYLDRQLMVTSKEVYVEPLKGPEKVKHGRQVQVYVIRWHPSQYSVDPIEEIILDDLNDDPKRVIKKLSELSTVPEKYISCTEGISFPVEISCLDIEYKFEWNSVTSCRHSLGLYEDGRVIYYKDNRETMKELTDKERSEIQEAEEERLERIRECKLQLSRRY